MDYQIIHGDALAMLRTLPAESVQTCVTSPPYYGLRDYGIDGQIGLEGTPQLFVERLVEVFREVRRVLKKDGTCWINLGDSYASDDKWGGCTGGKHAAGIHGSNGNGRQKKRTGLKSKDLIGIPWRVAFALQSDGWWLRQDIIWSKPNPMPESVTDRCTKSHEYIFLITKSARYFYDADAIREPLQPKTFTTFGTQHRPQGNDGLGLVKSDNWGSTVSVRKPKMKVPSGWDTANGTHTTIHREGGEETTSYTEFNPDDIAGANKRSVWTVATQAMPEAHFATFPEKLIEPCILAGSREGDTVLDPFNGAGTTGLVSLKHKRKYIGIELNPEYIAISERRLSEVQVKLFT